MNRKRLFISLILLAFAVASCGVAKAEEPMVSRGAVVEEMAMSAPAEEAIMMDADGSGEYRTERIVIKNADMSIVVIDPVEAQATIAQMAEDKGGFVVNSYSYKVTTSSGKELPAGNITIRVPAEVLDETLEEIKALVEDADLDILSESVSGQDVTNEVTDLDSRLRNLRQAEEQLLEIMDEAKETEDVVSVFRELTRIREEIEVLEGQLKYYEESAKLSAIHINLQAKEAVAPITIGGWRPSLTIQRALQALVDGLKFLANAVIWIIIFVAPIVLLIGLPIFLIIRASKKRSAKKKANK